MVSDVTCLREIVFFAFGAVYLALLAVTALAAMGFTATFAVLDAAEALAFFFSASSFTSLAFVAASSLASFSA